MNALVEFLKKINRSQFRIFNSPVVELNRKVYDPNFTPAEKKQLRTIFRLLLNEYLINHFKWHPEQKVRETISKIPQRIFIDKGLKLDSYVGKYYMPLMKKSEDFQHLVEQTDLHTLPDKTVSELLQLEVPINKHPVFHNNQQNEERPKPDKPVVDTDKPDVVLKDTTTEKPKPSDPEILKKRPDNGLNTFIAGLTGLTGNEKSSFLNKHKGQLLDKKNASKVFNKDLAEQKLNKINYAKGLLQLTENNKELTTQLFKMQRMTSLKDLAKNKNINWGNLVKKGVGAQKSGEQLEKTLADSFPTPYVTSRVNKKSPLLTKFINANPDLDIFSVKTGKKQPQKYDWAGLAPKDRIALIKEIKAYQRTKFLAGDVRKVPSLLNSGFNSAQDIVSTNRQEFIKKSGLLEKDARQVYKNAQNVNNETLTALAMHLENQRNASIPFINTKKGTVPEDIDYQEIFGSLNFCECEHCNSVLSPAAYFVDLLNFIKTNNLKALNELKRRRSDLWDIKLNCDQTHTTQPYLELINEVLSNYIVSGAAKLPNAPDNIEDILYMPWVNPELPYEPDCSKARLLAEGLDTSLFEIYEAMEVAPVILMAEYLGLGPHTLKWVIAGQPLPFNITSLKVHEANTFANLFNISYDELKALAASDIGSNLEIQAVKLGIQSYQEQVKVTNNTPKQRDEYLKKVFTFLRIYRHLDYGLEELDLYLSLSMVGNKQYSAVHLANFSVLMYIKNTFELSDEDIKVFVQGYDPAIKDDYEATLIEDDQVTLSKILLLLGLTQEDFDRLIAAYEDNLDLNGGELVLESPNLSLLKRNVYWASGAGMSIKEWLLFLEFYGIKKLVLNNNWQALIAKIVQHENIGIPVQLSDFYLKNQENEEWSFSITEQSLLDWFESLTTNETQFIGLDDWSIALGELLTADDQLIRVLFNEMITAIFPVEGEEKFIKLVNSLVGTEIDVTAPGFSKVLNFFKLLDKNLQLLSFLNLTGETLEYFFVNLSSFNINPKKPKELLSGIYNFSRWMEGLEDDLAVARVLLIDGLNSTTITDEQKSLLQDYFDLEVKTLEKVLNLFADNPSKLEQWNKFFNAVEICLENKLTPEQLQIITDVEQINLAPRKYYQQLVSFFEQSLELSTYSEDKKQEILDEVTDALLEEQRDALVALLKKSLNVDFSSTAKIYEYFLLDVETSACSDVSPIKAAILSVQLFIQRCLMNLEEDVNNNKLQFDDDDKKEWEWRKNYRVWEVNRKIFLYPENYLDPNLRDDKTPIYEELEGDIQQRDLTLEAIEKTYLRYLKQFSFVAKLEITGSFKNSINGLYYYFGRSSNSPYQYFYKTYNKDNREWSAWVEIDLKVESSYLTGTIINGRLFVFWLEYKYFQVNEIINGSSVPTSKYQHILNYSYLEEDNNWSTTVKVELAHLTVERFVSSSTRRTDTILWDFLYVKESGEKLLVYYFDGNWNLFASEETRNMTGLEERVAEIDIPSRKYIRDIKPSTELRAPYLYTRTIDSWGPGQKGITIQNPGYSLSMSTFFNSTSTFHFFSEDVPQIITSTKDIAIINGQSSWNYVLKNGEKYYQLLIGNQGIFPINSFVTDEMSEKLFNNGIDDLLSPSTQMNTTETHDLEINYDATGHPKEVILPEKGLDFNGANGVYFKELYFHIPFTLAKHYNQNQKFEEADYWFRKIFDPTVEYDAEEKFWQYTPFRDSIADQMELILKDTAALAKYHKDPFNPHAIARLRTGAYPKAVVMSYIDNLLDWGDHLFRQDTFESINEAMMLYITAQQLLGTKPRSVKECDSGNENMTFADVEGILNSKNEILIEVESFIIEKQLQAFKDQKIAPKTLLGNAIKDPESMRHEMVKFKPGYNDGTLTQSITTELFCIPWNDNLMQYWDTVEDRMFKIRNCLNIDGEYRQLALFEPPIDPMLLVRARAAGISLSQLTSQDNTLPYRFNYLLDKAKSYIQMAQGFGQTLLATMEKEDGEALNDLRTIHESNILQMLTQNKEKLIEELEYNRVNLGIIKEKLNNNIQYFKQLLSGNILSGFKNADKKFKKSGDMQKSAKAMNLLTSSLFMLPQLGAPTAITFGGKQVGKSSEKGINAFQAIAQFIQLSASIIEKFQNQKIREMGWQQQLVSNEKDLENTENDLLINELKMAVAERDLEIHEQNIEQNQEILDFYADKMTNEALYNLMKNQLTKLFRDAYGLAFQTALDAQKAYHFEIDDPNASFIAYDNWDTATMGLLSAEKLQYQLMQMETTYLEKNTRKAEIRSHVSLAGLNAKALLELKSTGNTSFTIPETWFDLQYPGQYKRRIKSVAVTIPCVVGPYVNVPCKLKLKSSRIRINPNLSEALSPSPEIPDGNDRIFTSNAQNDAGILEFSFRDERYLPFEGSGVDSEWELKLPARLKSFDYNTITDVIFHINYTAEYDELFGQEVEDAIQSDLNTINENGLVRVFSLKHEFPKMWYQASTDASPMTVEIKPAHFPYFTQGTNIRITNAVLNEVNTADNEINEISGNITGGTGSVPLSVDIQLDEEDFEKELFLVVNYSI